MTNMLKKVFNWSGVHLSEMTCYKIHTLIRIQPLFFFVSSTRNNLMKEKNDLEGVQEMSIDQLHMYQLTPKKTFKKKTKPPLGIVIFKVIT